METTVFETIADYGVLGIVCLAMGWMLYNYWKKDQKEKQRLIERLEDCNDKIKEYADNEKGD
jgi:hypothetical protein